MHKLDKFWLSELNRAVKLADEARSDLNTMVMSGAEPTRERVAQFIMTNAYLLDLLTELWKDIYDRIDYDLKR